MSIKVKVNLPVISAPIHFDISHRTTNVTGYAVQPGQLVKMTLEGNFKDASILAKEYLPEVGGWPRIIFRKQHFTGNSVVITFKPRERVKLGPRWHSVNLSRVLIYVNGHLVKTVNFLLGKLDSGKYVKFTEYAGVDLVTAVTRVLRKKYPGKVNIDVTECVRKAFPCVKRSTVVQLAITDIDSHSIISAKNFTDPCRYILSGVYPVKVTLTPNDAKSDGTWEYGEYVVLVPALFNTEVEVSNDGKTCIPGVKVVKEGGCWIVKKDLSRIVLAGYSPKAYIHGFITNSSFHGKACVKPDAQKSQLQISWKWILAGVIILMLLRRR